MSRSRPHLDFLSFDASGDTDGVHTFDAMASTSRERHAAVLAEVEQVLAWATSTRARAGATTCTSARKATG